MDREQAITAAQEKSRALAAKLGKPVHLITVDSPEGIVTGYLQEPGLRTKLTAINHLAAKDMTLAGETILNACLIKEESDERLDIAKVGSSKVDTTIYASAVLQCLKLVELYEGDVKKN